MGQAAVSVISPPVYMGPFHGPGHSVHSLEYSDIQGANQGVYALPERHIREIYTPIRESEPTMYLSPPACTAYTYNLSTPGRPAGQLLNELQAFHASDGKTPQRVGKIKNSSSLNTDTAVSESRPVAWVKGVRVLPSGDKPLLYRPKTEYQNHYANWQLGNQNPKKDSNKPSKPCLGSPRLGDKLLQGRKKDAEIADALSHLKFKESESELTIIPGAPRGLNFEKCLGYFP